MTKSFNIGSQHVIVRAEAKDTNGICAVLEMHHPPVSGPPLHVHSLEDEGFYVLEGKYQFTLRETETILGPGEFIMAARGVPHKF